MSISPILNIFKERLNSYYDVDLSKENTDTAKSNLINSILTEKKFVLVNLDFEKQQLSQVVKFEKIPNNANLIVMLGGTTCNYGSNQEQVKIINSLIKGVPNNYLFLASNYLPIEKKSSIIENDSQLDFLVFLLGLKTGEFEVMQDWNYFDECFDIFLVLKKNVKLTCDQEEIAFLSGEKLHIYSHGGDTQETIAEKCNSLSAKLVLFTEHKTEPFCYYLLKL